MKRFTVRKVKCHSYSRQGWKLADLGFRFVVVDREWRKNKQMAHDYWDCHDEKYKNIDSFYSKVGAQYVADWFNEHCSNEWGHSFYVPGNVFNEAIKMHDPKVA